MPTKKIKKVSTRQAAEIKQHLTELSGTTVRDDAYVVWYNSKPIVVMTPDRGFYSFRNVRSADSFITRRVRASGK